MTDRPSDLDSFIDSFATAVVERRLTVPAVLFLESSKPLSFLGSQALHAMAPFARMFTSGDNIARAAATLEDRTKLEALLRRIELLEAQRTEGPKTS